MSSLFVSVNTGGKLLALKPPWTLPQHPSHLAVPAAIPRIALRQPRAILASSDALATTRSNQIWQHPWRPQNTHTSLDGHNFYSGEVHITDHDIESPQILTGDVWQTHLLCLSRGNADGLGDVREKELKACTAYLGLSSDRVQVLEDPQLQDGMKTHWDEGHIAAIVEEQLLKHNIDVVFTFDGYGVSGHANHIATHHGVKIALQRHQERCSAAAAADDEPKDKVVRGWELESTSLLRKYVGLLDTPLSYWLAGRQDAQDDRQFVFVFRPRWNYNAMALHRSQFVWYRRLFVAFSRYSFINTFRPLVPSDAISANQKKTQ